MCKKRWKSLQVWFKYDSVMTHKFWSFDRSILFCRCLHMAASRKKLKSKLCWPQALKTWYTPSHLKSELTSYQSRRFFPKCSIPMAVASDPPGFGSVEETYGWAHAFMKTAAHHFGKDFIKERLEAWDWSLSSSFSGVGCAEQVPVLNSSRFQMCLINSPPYLLCPLHPWISHISLCHRLPWPCSLLPSSFVTLAERAMWRWRSTANVTGIAKGFWWPLMALLVPVCSRTSWKWTNLRPIAWHIENIAKWMQQIDVVTQAS